MEGVSGEGILSLPLDKAAASLHPCGSSPGKRVCPPAPSPSGGSGSPPRCFTVLGEGGMKPQARDIYSQCGLTFPPREERSRKEGLVAETKRHLLYCSRTGDNGRPLRNLLCLISGVPAVPRPRAGWGSHLMGVGLSGGAQQITGLQPLAPRASWVCQAVRERGRGCSPTSLWQASLP